MLGNPVSDYLTFLAVLVGLYGVYLTTIKLLESRLARRIVDNRTQLYERLLGFARNPLKFILATVGFWLAMRIFNMPETARKITRDILLAFFAITACYVLLKVIDALVEFLKPRVARTESRLDDHLLPVFSSALKAFVIIVTILLVIQNMGYNITSLLAGLGLGGLAVALAAQDTLSNVFGAIAIFVDQPFHVGDAVSIAGFTGNIEEIGIRSTRLRTFEGTLVTLPNSEIAKSKVENLSARPTRRTVFTIGVTYDTPREKLERGVQILREVMAEHPATQQYRAYFNSYGDFSLNILAQHWCKHLDYEAYLKCIEEINFEIMKRFEEEGIEFAFPTQTLYIKTEQPPDGQVLAERGTR
ncbi:MAG: mechanosensitive ion channel family protein [Calditrichaeota bacterium]|nr:MAG: mechanosensitive ion channel family protein [Calditrichota bacterium]